MNNTTETTQFTLAEIKKMNLETWIKNGRPVRPFTERFGITREQAREKIASLVVGELYEDKDGCIFKFLGGKNATLQHRSASSGTRPLLDNFGELTNIWTIVELVPCTRITTEEFDECHNLSSQSMQEWCDRFGAD